MSIAILCIGTELINGQVLNTNSQWIAKSLADHHYSCTTHISIRDEAQEITQALDYVTDLHEVVIITGGLGATSDDITLALFAMWSEQTLILEPSILNTIADKYRIRQKPMPDGLDKMAMFPNLSQIIPNDLGLAPGCYYKYKDSHFFILPGVPFESKQMWQQYVLPQLFALFPHTYQNFKNSYLCGLIGEVHLQQLLQPILATYHLQASYLPDYGTVRLNIEGSHMTASIWDEAVQLVEEVLQPYSYSKNNTATLAQLVLQHCKSHQLKLSTAESCTGGLLTHLFTNISGSSAILMGGINTYSIPSKIKLLGIPAQLIEEHTVYSEQVAAAMAEQTRVLYNSDIGIGTTGTLEKDKDNKLAGAHIAISNGTQTFTHYVQLPYDRLANKLYLANIALIHTLNFIDKNYNSTLKE